MYFTKCISKVFNQAKKIDFDDSSKIIIMSDCHRSDGNWDDDFARNQNLLFHALTYYYDNNYTYIDLGDGEDLWKVKSFEKIVDYYSHLYWLLRKFYKESRLHFIYGNHDIVKRNKNWLKNNYYSYFDSKEDKQLPLFKDIDIYEGIILNHIDTKDKILLMHGHQADLLNNTFWIISRFLVRYLWRPLQVIGINNPTQAAKNYEKMNSIEKKLINWCKTKNQMLIAGHTHRPVFPDVKSPHYFNDGCGIHPRCITGIEIVNSEIMLIKWSIKTRLDGTLFVEKDILAGPTKLIDYFNNEKIPS